MPAWLHYGLAVGLTAVVVALRVLLDEVGLLRETRFLLFALPVILASWMGGFGPGLIATLLCLLAADFLFIEPRYSFGGLTTAAWVPLIVFLLQGLIISWLGESRRRSLRLLEAANEQLESRVQHRTADLREANTQLREEVTERQRAAAELRQANVKLEASNRELQDFASVASHDLQEPLRKIQAFGGRLQDRYESALGEEGQDYLQRMLNAAARMQTLINDLLSFSRVTTRAQPFQPVDLNQIAQEVVSDLETRIDQSGGRVEIEPLPTIDADPLQMRQLLQNLLSNALKFRDPNRPPVVRVYARQNGEAPPAGEPELDQRSVQVVVEDNGIGFDEKYLDRIFNVFQRLHGRGTYEGTGIGLAVCRKIAERHGGTISGHSRLGAGATFITELPVRQIHGDTADGAGS